MGKLMFDSSGRFIGLKEKKDKDNENITYFRKPKRDLKKSDSLYFLKKDNQKFKNVFDSIYWNFYSDGEPIKPLRFSNGKTQENVVKEVTDLIKQGHKVIFLKGVCGSGKSAIALNIARIFGRASIVVPLKNLQKQYEDDYTGKKYLIKSNGEKMKIAMITGRDNHDCLIKPGLSCADPSLPENIKLIERNFQQIIDYYEKNPFIKNKIEPELKDIRRLSIAPSNPYWSPIFPSEFEARNLKDAEKIKYMGVNSREYIFYHRKQGCSYYDQYLAYLKADVIIFNAAKYKIELTIGRKPETDIEIIDEADEFIDSLFEQDELNLTRLYSSLKLILPEDAFAKQSKEKILELITLEEKNKKAIGVNENLVFHIEDTKILGILKILLENNELECEILLDELNYSNRALDVARNFKDNFKDVYLTYKKIEDNLFVKLVSANLSGKIKSILDKGKAFVFMSGTLHSENIIKNVLGISDFKIVEAETLNQGTIEIIRTGKEFDCKFANFNNSFHSRKEYLESLSKCLERAKPPMLIHVNAFKDLPSEQEKENMNIPNLIPFEKLLHIQKIDKIGANILNFKKGITKVLFTTRCSRGMDFPGQMCNSVLFTKYPNSNISNVFWKVLKKTHSEYFWEFYKDKAKREFLQRMYRAIRSVNDHIYVLSPDMRVIDAVREMQLGMEKGSI